MNCAWGEGCVGQWMLPKLERTVVGLKSPWPFFAQSNTWVPALGH